MERQDIIVELYQCASECNNCNEASLKEKYGSHLERCIKLTRECYEVCNLTAHTLERGSEHSNLFLTVCARICNECAAECEKHPHDHCRKCAEACRRCAERCISEQSSGHPEILEVI